MVLDHALVAPGDENEMLDAGLARLVDHVLDQRPVDHRQHLLRHRLGGGQKAGAEAGDGKNGFANRFHVGRIMGESGGSGHREVASLGLMSGGRPAAMGRDVRKPDGKKSDGTVGGDFHDRGGGDVAANFRDNRCWRCCWFGAGGHRPSAAPRCRNTGSFDTWLAAFKKDAEAQGISRQAIAAALDGVTFDPAIIRRDSGQGVFQQSFLQFAGRMTAPGRYQNGLKQLKANAALLSRIEQRTGVPPPVVVGLWGLESDYGAYKGGIYQIIRSVATLAYDCRRSAFFRDQLMGAVRIVERGDLRPDRDDRQLGGRAWADAVYAGGLFQARPRLRRRRPRRHGPQRAGRARLRRQPAEELRLAEGPALAAGGAGAGADAVAGVRPRHPASALAMGEVGRHRGARPACRPTTCRRR